MAITIRVTTFYEDTYTAHLAYCGLSADYNRTFTLNENGGLVHCSARDTSLARRGVWVELNPVRKGATKTTEDGRVIAVDGPIPRRANRECIGIIQNITLDWAYPPEPRKAHYVGLALVQHMHKAGLTPTVNPVEDTGAGGHTVTPIVPIVVDEGTGELWNTAVANVVKRLIVPAFDTIAHQLRCVDAEDKPLFKLGGYDITRCMSAPGTYRPSRKPTDCAALKHGYMRGWLTPYDGTIDGDGNNIYPKREESQKLHDLIVAEYEQLTEGTKTHDEGRTEGHGSIASLPDWKPVDIAEQADQHNGNGHHEQPFKTVDNTTYKRAVAWLNHFVERNPAQVMNAAGDYFDRSSFFQFLTNLTYERWGADVTWRLRFDINQPHCEGKFDGRQGTEMQRSLLVAAKEVEAGSGGLTADELREQTGMDTDSEEGEETHNERGNYTTPSGIVVAHSFISTEISLWKECDFLVDGLLEMNSVSMPYAESGTGKTFFALHIAHMVAHGLPCFGKKTTQGDVLYVYAEGKSGLNKRITACRKLHNLPHIDSIEFIPKSVHLVHERQLILDTTAYFTERRGKPPVLIIFDTFTSNALGVKQNIVEEVTQALAVAHELVRLYECHVMILHHDNKQGGFNGSKGFLNDVDTMIELQKQPRVKGKGMSFITHCFKPRDAEPFDDFLVETELVDVYAHPTTGEMVRSLAIKNKPSGGITITVPADPLSEGQRSTLLAFGSKVEVTNTAWKEQAVGNGIPKGTAADAIHVLAQEKYVEKTSTKRNAPYRQTTIASRYLEKYPQEKKL